ncbi:MAG: mechanosensitive ion channel [Verrucomicrobia bacterium]|nr:mechanosensitive ion channel [Verrucomicrobiota bacterium]
MTNTTNLVTHPISDHLLEHAAIFSEKLGVSLLIFFGFYLGSLVAMRIIGQVGGTSDQGRRDILNLIGQIAKISLLVFGAVTALGTLGVNVSALVAGLGLTGFALGFAFRDALSNLLAGILILFYRPFRRGDFIAVAGFEGTVVCIDLRYTTLEGQGKIFLIPNSTLFTNCIALTKTTAIAPGAPESSPLKMG